jgi:hypothetical protein
MSYEEKRQGPVVDGEPDEEHSQIVLTFSCDECNATWPEDEHYDAICENDAVVCENERYCKERTRFASVEDFEDMCELCFGATPTLRRGTDSDGTTVFYDEHDEIALRWADADQPAPGSPRTRCPECGASDLRYVTKTLYEVVYSVVAEEEEDDIGDPLEVTLFDLDGNHVDTLPAEAGTPPETFISEDFLRCKCGNEFPVPAHTLYAG